MAYQPLSLETIKDLSNGETGAIVGKTLADLAKDLDDRGDDHKVRTVTIVISAVKRGDGTVEVDVQAHAKLPPLRTFPTITKLVNKDGQMLLFMETESPDNPDQRPLPFQHEGS